MSLTAWIEDLLPGKWAQRFAIATLPTCAGAASLPSTVPPSILALTEEQVFFVRLLLFCLTFVTFEVMISIALAVHVQNKKKFSWVRKLVTTSLVVTAFVVLSPLVLPAAFYPDLPERTIFLYCSSATVGSILLFTILIVLVAHAKKVETLSGKSFWER